eukprot:tig00001331_g8175.t1
MAADTAAAIATTLERLLERRGRLDPATVLEVGVALARLAHGRHRQGELLGAGGPLHPRFLRVELRDRDARVELETAAPERDPSPLEAAAFSAPELTGRMDPSAVVDERTDLYRIGVLLYTALAGSPPFSGGTLIEMLHAHLAKRPPPLRAAPRALEAIVDRLLEKSPAARYQSAFGLLHDLLRCRRLLREGCGEAVPFALGERDRSGRPDLSDALHGRAAELAAALAAIRRARTLKQPCMILVSGPPGAGKSFLAREIGRRAVSEGIASRLVAGKADQYSSVPYPIITRCLEDLAGQLAASGRDVPLWRGALLGALQGNARLIADLAPATRLILGSELPPVGELAPTDLQARLRAAIGAFLRVALVGPSPAPGARPAPLLLLCDDLQWADAEGRNISPAHVVPDLPFVIIGTIREEEAAPGAPPGPLRARILDVNRPAVPVLDLALGRLSREGYRQLVSRALKEGGEGLVEALAGVLEARTGGNPLHAVQLLRALCEQARPYSPLPSLWDETRAEAAAGGVGLLDAFAADLLALPRPSQDALKVASCCGPGFDVETLGTVLGVSAEEAAGRLRPALAARLLAAHELLEPAERAALCLRAGLLLRASRPDLPASEAVYEVANLLNSGLAGAGPGADQAALVAGAEVNLHAARRARACSGFGRALEYALAGLRALAAAGLARAPSGEAPADGGAGGEHGSASPEEAPRKRQRPPHPAPEPPALEGAEFELTLIRAEAEYVFKVNFELADALFERAAAVARSRSDSIRVYRLRVALLSSMQRFRESCEAGLEALRAFWGLHVDPEVTLEDFERDVESLVAALAARCPAAALDPAAASPAALAAALAALPACASEETPELLRFGAEAALSAGYAQLPALLCVVPARCLLASLDAGRAPEQAVLFGILGHACAAVDRLLPLAGAFSELCLAFAAAAPDGRLQARSLCWAALSAVWRRPFPAALEFAEASTPLAVQSGSLVDACLASTISVGLALWACEPLPALERRAAASIRVLQSCKQDLHVVLMWSYAEWARILRRGPAALETLSALPLLPGAAGGRVAAAFDAGRFARLLEGLPCWLIGQFAAVTVFALLSLPDPAPCALPPAWKAVELFDERGVELLQLRASFSSYPDFLFAAALAAAARLSEGDVDDSLRGRLVARLEGYAARYGPLASASPRNYGPRLRILEAELARAAGAEAGALRLYETAADEAAAEGYHFLVGLASERAASLAGAAGLERARGGYLRAAAEAYGAWGGEWKAAALLAAQAPPAPPPPPAPLPVGQRPQRSASFESVAGASSSSPFSASTGSSSSLGAGAAGGVPRRRPSGQSTSNLSASAGGHSAFAPTRSSSSDGGGSLNWDSLVQASQCLLSEVHLPRLLERLVATVLEIAGAQRGFVLLRRERRPGDAGAEEAEAGAGPARDFRLEASGEVLDGEAADEADGAAFRIQVLQGQPLAERAYPPPAPSPLPSSPSHLSQAPLLRNYAGEEAAGSGGGTPSVCDGYVASAGVKSLLAIPILHQGRAMGCLYLENRLLGGAFTRAAIETLTILSTSLAVSVANARLYEHLSRSLRECEAVLRTAHDAILTLGPDLEVTSANPASERLWGAGSASLRGRRLPELLQLAEPAEGEPSPGEGEADGPSPRTPGSARFAAARPAPAPDPLAPLLPPGASFALERVWKGYALGLAPSGARVEVEVCFAAFDGEGAPGAPGGPGGGGGHGYAAFVRDVSGRVRAEEHLQRLQRRWFAMATHDLRTPLNGILGMHELLAETPLSEEQREYVDNIGASGSVLLSLMNSILEYSRLEEGAEAASPSTPFDPVHVLEETVLMSAQTARAKEIDVLLFVPPAIPRAVLGDVVAFRRIVMNFVSNGVKFSPRGGRVELRLAALGPVEGPGEAAFRVSVRDNGEGVPAELQRLLFRPFSQLGPSRPSARMFEGTGLGLAITKRLAEAMGGRVGVASEEGRGAEFWAVVRLAPPPPPPSPGPRRRRRPRPGPTSRGRLPRDPRALPRRPRRGAAVLPAAVGRGARPCRRRLARGAPGPTSSSARTPRPRPASDGAVIEVPVRALEHEALAPAAGTRGACVLLPVRPSQLARALAARLQGHDKTSSAGSPRSSSPPLSGDASPGHPSPAAPPCRPAASRPEPRPWALVVDDMPALPAPPAPPRSTNVLMLRRMAEALGLAVDTAADGARAAALYGADPLRYAIILLDVEMPVCDGREACRRVRALEAERGLRRVPVVFVSANAMPEDRAEALAHGGDDFKTKPIRRAELAAVVERFVPSLAGAASRAAGAGPGPNCTGRAAG